MLPICAPHPPPTNYRPNPTIAELEAAARGFCALSWRQLQAEYDRDFAAAPAAAPAAAVDGSISGSEGTDDVVSAPSPPAPAPPAKVSRGHQYTYTSQLPYRCLEALYIVTLLEKGFGFERDDRSITYALEVRMRAFLYLLFACCMHEWRLLCV